MNVSNFVKIRQVWTILH